VGGNNTHDYLLSLSPLPSYGEGYDNERVNALGVSAEIELKMDW